MPTSFLRRQRRPEGQKARANSFADLPKVIAAAPVQPALFETTPTGEASLAALAEILDTPATHHAPRHGVDALLVKSQPSAAQAKRLSAAIIRVCASFDRCRVVARDARTKDVCSSWAARMFSALRCAEKMIGEEGERRIARYDACDTLLTALFAADSVLSLLMDSSDCGSLQDAAIDGHMAAIRALQAEASPVAESRADVMA